MYFFNLMPKNVMYFSLEVAKCVCALFQCSQISLVPRRKIEVYNENCTAGATGQMAELHAAVQAHHNSVIR